MIHVRQAPDHIEHPSAYEAAIKQRIKANAAKTRRAKWYAANPDAERLSDWLHQSGEFKDRYACGNSWSNAKGACCENYDIKCSHIGPKAHPLVRGIFEGDFGKVLLNMQKALVEWGGLSEKQTDLVRRALARAEERLAKAQQRREEKLAADREGSQHIGVVGERREFSIRCERVFEFEGQYGVTFINICRDADNNVIVYKGSNGFERGWSYVVKASVKAHDERDGVAQTLIARPKILSESAPEEAGA